MKTKSSKKRQAPDEQLTQLYDRITKIEVKVLQKIQQLKTSNKTFLCQHLDIPSPQCGPYDPAVNYYDQFWKRFLLNEIGKQNVNQSQMALQTFERKMEKIDGLFKQWEKEMESVPSQRTKRTTVQNAQRQKCELCGRTFKDKQTLGIHVRVKHEEEKMGQEDRQENESIFQEDNQ